MDIRTIATLLLLGKIISLVFILLVLKKQWNIRKKTIHPTLRKYRTILFVLALVILIGTIIPIVVDLLTLLTNIDRENSPSIAGIIYAFSNDITFLIASILIWTLYKLSSAVIEIDDLIVTGADIYASRVKTDVALDQERVQVEKKTNQDLKKSKKKQK